MKILRQILPAAILAAIASAHLNSDDTPPLAELQDPSHAPSFLHESPISSTISSTVSSLPQAPTPTAISTSPNTDTASSQWLHTTSIMVEEPPRSSTPSGPPPSQVPPTQTIESGCSASELASSLIPSQTRTMQIAMGYLEATSVQLRFTWRRCGGGSTSQVESSVSATSVLSGVSSDTATAATGFSSEPRSGAEQTGTMTPIGTKGATETSATTTGVPGQQLGR